MGFKVNEKIKAKCPLYEDVIRTNNGTLAGVQCRFFCDNFGFDAHTIIRVRDYSEVRDLKEIFCDDMYKTCPYYQVWLERHKKEAL